MKIQFKTLLIASLLIPSLSHSEPIVTDRPDFTESSQVVELGKIQIEAGYTFSESDTTQGHTLGELLIRIPVLPRLEARLGINSFAFSNEGSTETSGLQDSSIGIKAMILPEQNGWIPQTSLIAGTTLPTGGNPYSESTLQPGVKFCFGWELSENWALSSNLNYDRSSEAGTAFNEFSQSLSLGWGFADQWGAYLEAFSFQPDLAGKVASTYINTGLTYLISDDLQLDARVGSGLNGINKDYFIGFGASSRFKI